MNEPGIRTGTWRLAKSLLRAIRDPHGMMAKYCMPLVLWGNWREQVTYHLPQRVRRVLFVCKGNICRSPLAAAYLGSRLDQQKRLISVGSAGLETTPGRKAHPLALFVAQQHGLSLEAHVTAPLIREMVDHADLILVMEDGHLDKILKAYPEAKTKVFHLGCFNRKTLTEIADPYNGTIDDFEHCFTLIRRCCDNLCLRIKATFEKTVPGPS